MRAVCCPCALQTSKDWQSTGNTGYQGKVSHHGPGKPFKDGYVNKQGVAAAAAAEHEDEVSLRSLMFRNLVSEAACSSSRLGQARALGFG